MASSSRSTRSMRHDGALKRVTSTCKSVLDLQSTVLVHEDAMPAAGASSTDDDFVDAAVPVFVMLPLDTVYKQQSSEGGPQRTVLKTPKNLMKALQRLKAAGVKGVMVDVWWSMVEHVPVQYNFDAYLELLDMAAHVGLKVQCVMSFHAAGGNVGDNVNIPLPDWVLKVGEQDNPDIFYTDASGFHNPECISLGCDDEPVLEGRTPMQVYRQFVDAFLSATEGYLGWVVSEITVGLGPAGELRYPSYPEGDGRWRFPGIGEFQCYDRYMLDDLRSAARAVGRPEWGHGGPHDSGNYTKCPWETGFFHPNHGSYKTDYGDFFLSWYSGLLIRHGDRMLDVVGGLIRERCPQFPPAEPWDATAAPTNDAAVGAGAGLGFPAAIRCVHNDGSTTVKHLEEVKVGVKLAGVHWWYRSQSHAGELTAGYYNVPGRDGYKDIMAMLKRHGAVVNFTAVEMRDCEQPDYAKCSPQGLLAQLQEAATGEDIPLSGENALQRYDKFALDQIEHVSYGEEPSGAHGGVGHPALKQLTFLRMGQPMFDNWDAFESFIARMNRKLPREVSEAGKISLQQG